MILGQKGSSCFRNSIKGNPRVLYFRNEEIEKKDNDRMLNSMRLKYGDEITNLVYTKGIVPPDYLKDRP